MNVLEMFRLDGKTALVTGCRRGIGKAMAVALAEAGADIVGVSRSMEPSGSDVEKAVTAVGRTYRAYTCNFGDRAAVAAFAAQVNAEIPAIDILVIPGGVVSAQMDSYAVREWIARTSAAAGLTASVCTGSFLLAQAGILRGRRATTHWEDAADLQRGFPDVQVVPDVRWVDEGSVVTAAGVSAGLDMSLHLVERFEGEALAVLTARQMDYRWQRAATAKT